MYTKNKKVILPTIADCALLQQEKQNYKKCMAQIY
jgi:hypothetical protein